MWILQYWLAIVVLVFVGAGVLVGTGIFVDVETVGVGGIIVSDNILKVPSAAKRLLPSFLTSAKSLLASILIKKSISIIV
ncbi:hypothetical protein Bccel_5191 [Pseudobacteroides cellulosolvens ATCC 35603 = DSM 2933]|uniref:Uncharacterized protein n=1 Tax=Pseudobacteroides cellulosolvens ATCC 35603 = DSM 2933 TaxID=398512 RepID=A0A0L6JW11_9FIRM|nr:hypothetical protein [Pseudobacteroides cellulosolvens]KNY29914.1 hypothetical protein Bccel_5191 [Pseudobacteroides cellulosolvens ATCC 35603 = DSM 2933]